MSKKLKLTPQGIVEKQFDVISRGYNPVEVDRFLDTIVEDYELLQEQIDELTAQLQTCIRVQDVLKKKNHQLELEFETLKARSERPNENSFVNADLLKRLARIETAILDLTNNIKSLNTDN